MREWWTKLDTEAHNGAVFYLLLTLCWIGISLGLDSLRTIKNCFEVKAVLESKALGVAVIFLGRYLFFKEYRSPISRIWALPLFFLVIFTSTAVGAWSHPFDWRFWLAIFLDGLLWAFFLTMFLETVVAVCQYWKGLTPNPEPVSWQELWERFGKELIKLGLWLTLAMALCYDYLVNFYVVDTVLYSYLLGLPIIMLGLILYLNNCQKINIRIRQEINLIDRQLMTGLQWARFENDRYVVDLPRYQYLLLTREYWQRFTPPFSVSILGVYLIYILFMLSLPYLFGVVM